MGGWRKQHVLQDEIRILGGAVSLYLLHEVAVHGRFEPEGDGFKLMQRFESDRSSKRNQANLNRCPGKGVSNTRRDNLASPLGQREQTGNGHETDSRHYINPFVMKGSNQGFGFNATILADQDPVEGSLPEPEKKGGGRKEENSRLR
uniref:Uncharacterized protein n=1 Tax=Anopheles merus TaxID=30066 RepID=A0A182UZM9_ANOME